MAVVLPMGWFARFGYRRGAGEMAENGHVFIPPPHPPLNGLKSKRIAEDLRHVDILKQANKIFPVGINLVTASNLQTVYFSSCLIVVIEWPVV